MKNDMEVSKEKDLVSNKNVEESFIEPGETPSETGNIKYQFDIEMKKVAV